MILKHVDRKDQIVRRPRLAVAPLDALADRNRDLGIVAVVLVTGRNPGNNIVTPFSVGVVKVERLIDKVPARFGRAGQQERIKRIVVFELAAAVPLAGTVGYKRAITRHGALLTTTTAPVENKRACNKKCHVQHQFSHIL